MSVKLIQNLMRESGVLNGQDILFSKMTSNHILLPEIKGSGNEQLQKADESLFQDGELATKDKQKLERTSLGLSLCRQSRCEEDCC